MAKEDCTFADDEKSRD